MWLDHGIKPKAEKYAYVLVPNATEERMRAFQNKFPFKIVNEKSHQSVATISGNMAGIVFYESGRANIIGGVAVDKTCVLLLIREADGWKVHVSDPTHQLADIEISVKGDFEVENGFIENGYTKIRVQLPQNEESGKTVTLHLK